MPIYDYQCRQCGDEFELLVLRTSGTPACPACRSEDLEQLLSGFAVSSSGIRQANESKQRSAIANSQRNKDHKIAEKEYFIKEHKEHRQAG